MTGIYKITSPSGKVYIGQSRHIEKRIVSYKSARCKTQKRLYHSILKHGYEAHHVEVVIECKIEALDFWECYYIQRYDTFNTPHGMNLCSGGMGGRVVSDETRRKMSIANSGEKNKFYGKKHSKETIDKLKRVVKTAEWRKKISDANTCPTEETRLRMSKSQKKRQPPSDKTRIKMALSQTGRKHTTCAKSKISSGVSRPVLQYTIDGTFIKEFSSATDAAIETGIKRTTISGCLNGYAKSSKGFVWKKKQ